LKRVIEFVSERVVSNYVRNYKQTIFKSHLSEIKEDFINQYANEAQDDLEVFTTHLVSNRGKKQTLILVFEIENKTNNSFLSFF
jgi:hypothetical protein